MRQSAFGKRCGGVQMMSLKKRLSVIGYKAFVVSSSLIVVTTLSTTQMDQLFG